MMAREPGLAEDAYRESLALSVRLGDFAGQAYTLGQLGILYSYTLNRLEEAVGFYRQALETFVDIGDTAAEGRARFNVAVTLRELRRLGEASEEIRRAIDCDAQFGHAAEPWKSFEILAGIETDAGNSAAAAEAKREAIARYLAYRQDGGENHYPDGRLALAVRQSLAGDDAAGAAAALQQLAADPNMSTDFKAYAHALQAIVAGSRDRNVANAPELQYTMAAEILFLIETLEQAEGQLPSG